MLPIHFPVNSFSKHLKNRLSMTQYKSMKVYTNYLVKTFVATAW